MKPRLTLPRHLHRAILRLLRPAESAVRRLIIVMARGLAVTLPPPRPRKAKPASIFLKKPGGTGIYLPPGVDISAFPSPLRGLQGRSSDRASGSIVGREGRGDCGAIGVPGKIREASGGGPAARTLSLPLLDPLRPFRPGPRRPAANSIPRISFPCYVAPSPITPRLPPAPDDPLDATRLSLRLRALGAALDDLPGQAKRFARWRARAADAARKPDAAGAQKGNSRHTGRFRRVWPLRPGRPPGGRLARYDPDARRRKNIRDVDEILAHAHALARVALSPDTS